MKLQRRLCIFVETKNHNIRCIEIDFSKSWEEFENRRTITLDVLKLYYFLQSGNVSIRRTITLDVLKLAPNKQLVFFIYTKNHNIRCIEICGQELPLDKLEEKNHNIRCIEIELAED